MAGAEPRACCCETRSSRIVSGNLFACTASVTPGLRLTTRRCRVNASHAMLRASYTRGPCGSRPSAPNAGDAAA
jgi:hypothetical protein